MHVLICPVSRRVNLNAKRQLKSIYSRRISRRWEQYWEAALPTMNGENKEFPLEFGRGANDPNHCVILHLKKVGNAGSGWMQREHLFKSMKVSAVGRTPGEDVASHQASLGRVRTFWGNSERARQPIDITATVIWNIAQVLVSNKNRFLPRCVQAI